MIIVKKTAVLSPRGAHGVSGVARFECFKEKSDVRINLAGGRKDLYAVVAVGDEKRVVKLSGDRIYLARTDLTGDCAAIVADGEKRVICAGATVCGYDFSPLEELVPSAFGEGVKVGDDKSAEEKESEKTERETVADETANTEEAAASAEDVSSVEQGEKELKEKEIEENIVDISAEETDGKNTETSNVKETEAYETVSEKDPLKEGRFFDKISDKIEKLFSENEKDEEMSALIPDSRWARVRTGDGWYVVGIVGEPAEFICYGIPGDDPSDPPEEDEGCRQWVEVEKGGRGYWMMYQSAESGETLRAV